MRGGSTSAGVTENLRAVVAPHAFLPGAHNVHLASLTRVASGNAIQSHACAHDEEEEGEVCGRCV
jgi:hypothetical protein